MRVTNVELFFDLVYVYSIIQISHFLLEHQTWIGAVEAATIFAAVWWAWNYTAWSTNWVNPDHTAGRFLMIALMACAILMAVAIPCAFGNRAALFVGAYVVMALLRAGYMALLFRDQRMGRNYAQLCVWSAFSGLFWIAGALVPEHRLTLWIIAVLIDYGAPYLGFWLPGSGATPMESWPLAALHMLESNQQIFIISLGESILLLGATLVHGTLVGATLMAAALGFGVIVTLWWLYFVHTTNTGEHAFEQDGDHTKLARRGSPMPTASWSPARSWWPSPSRRSSPIPAIRLIFRRSSSLSSGRRSTSSEVPCSTAQWPSASRSPISAGSPCWRSSAGASTLRTHPASSSEPPCFW